MRCNECGREIQMKGTGCACDEVGIADVPEEITRKANVRAAKAVCNYCHIGPPEEVVLLGITTIRHKVGNSTFHFCGAEKIDF